MSGGWIPSRDDEVLVDRFGLARVVKVTGDHAIVTLQANGLRITASLESLKPTSVSAANVPDQPQTSTAASREPKSATSTAQFERRQSLEALRFGLVPLNDMERLTLGFEHLRDWTISQLPDAHAGDARVSEITGPYGSGKSHTMAAVRYIARQEGYLTARVEVDGRSISLAEPERLLFALWSTLEGSEGHSSTPILDLCVKAIEGGKPAPSIAPRGIDRVRDNYATSKILHRSSLTDLYGHALDAIMSSSDEFTASQVSQMICSNPHVSPFDVTVRRMIGQRVADRPYDFIEAWVGYTLLTKLAGHRGLVITVDEFEVEHLQSRQMHARVNSLLDVICRYLTGNMSHPKVPLAVFFATVGEEGHRGDQVIDDLIESANGGYFEVHEWSPEQRTDLAKRIHALYREAYGLTIPYAAKTVEAVEAQLESRADDDGGLIRAFIKHYVSALDSSFGPGARRAP